MRHKFLGFIHMNSVELTKVEVNANFELLERTTEDPDTPLQTMLL